MGGAEADTRARSPDEVTARVDALIAEIREKWHRPALEGVSAHHGDVAIVAHGHILRAFAQRWTGSPLDARPAFLMEAGGVGTLRFDSPPSSQPPFSYAPSLPLVQGRPFYVVCFG